MAITFCGPAFFYAIIAIVPLYLQFNYSSVITTGFLIHLSFDIIWVAFLYFLCMYGFNNIGWILVALPYVIGYFILKVLAEQAISNKRILTQFKTPNPNVISYLKPKI